MKLYGNKINKILLCIFLLIIVVKLFDVDKINTFDVMKGNNISDVEKKHNLLLERYKYKTKRDPYETIPGPQIPLLDNQLFMFSNNEYKPECCEYSNVLGRGGCACLTSEQIGFLKNRGMNNI